MARIIADELGGELDVVLVRKLRAPGQPELAIGAVDEAGSVLKGTGTPVWASMRRSTPRRRLEDFAREQRGTVKAHEAPAQGEV